MCNEAGLEWMGDRCAENFPSPISGAFVTAWRRQQQARPLGVCRAAVDQQQILYGLFLTVFRSAGNQVSDIFK